jgi:hypothetical protein
MQSAHITQRRCALAPLCYGSLMLYSGIRRRAFVISLLLIWGQGLIPMATLSLETLVPAATLELISLSRPPFIVS